MFQQIDHQVGGPLAPPAGLEGRERALFRTVVWWSLGLLVGMWLLVHPQSTPARDWMVVG